MSISPPTRRSLLPLLALAVLAVLVTACGGGSATSTPSTAAAQTSASPYTGLALDPAPDLSGVALPIAGADGATLPLKPGGDRLLLLFLGFTNCPDICPTTLADLRSAIKQLPAADRERIDVAVLTVDPTRDTPRLLTQYVQAFFPNGTALRIADDAELQRFTKEIGAAYQVAKDADGETEVIHSSFLYAIDGNGSLVLQWPFGVSSKALAADLELLLAEPPAS